MDNRTLDVMNDPELCVTPVFYEAPKSVLGFSVVA